MVNNKSSILEKTFCKETIILQDDNRKITNSHELAETFNTFFSNITQNLKIDSNLVQIPKSINISDPVLKTPPKYHQNNRDDGEQEYVLFCWLCYQPRKQF